MVSETSDKLAGSETGDERLDDTIETKVSFGFCRLEGETDAGAAVGLSFGVC